jgi:dTDP-4-dehydrorhamnose 3,5-epimerase
MILHPTTVAGAHVLEPERLQDERGFFARVWAAEELAAHGLVTSIVHCNVSFNTRVGTLRGLHFQRPPHEEVKIVRCTAGAVYDVIVDLRPRSETYLRWFGIELSAENRLSLYVPAGFAHGYQTLVDGAETSYLHSAAYAPGFDGGVRWDDPVLGIDWPRVATRTLSDRDARWPDYDRLRPFF